MKSFFSLCMFAFALTTITAQTDVKNAKDYSLLDRLPNYWISSYSEVEYDSQKFYFDKEYHMIEGRKFVIKYKHEQYDTDEYVFPSRLQILRNYSKAIEKAGGRILFERHNADHGYYSFKTSHEKKIWIMVKPASSGKYYTLIVIEEETMRQDIVIDAELIKNTIELEGKIAIYGIYFDTGKSVIKEESEPALAQIAEYLKNNPDVNCWVVGHTDSDGSFQLNSQLSLDRAKAIKERLHGAYSIAAQRLFAEGVASLSPVASNNSEEGKKLNRRVELVKK